VSRWTSTARGIVRRAIAAGDGVNRTVQIWREAHD
jgi:hypothetical protein